MQKVICFGSINKDEVYEVPHIVAPGETLASGNYSSNLGGKGANQSIALAKAGVPCQFVGKIGSDGDYLLKLLEEYGVETSLVTTSQIPTGKAIIQVSSSGQNSIVLFPGANHDFTAPEVIKKFGLFHQGQYLIMQNEIPFGGTIIEMAHEKGMTICFNPSPFTEQVFDYPLEFVDIFAVNEIEACCLVGLGAEEVQDFEQLCRKLSDKFSHARILLTVGPRGAYLGTRGTVRHYPAFDAVVRDTTAAGDTFLGYFLASELKGYGETDAFEFASKAAAITISRKGAGNSIPFGDEVFGL